jgi:excisionase family DNA binding protein
VYSIVKKDDLLMRLQPAQLRRFLPNKVVAMPSCIGLSPDLMTVKQVAHQLHVSPRTIWRYVARKQFPAPLRLSRARVRWRRDDIHTYLERMIDGKPLSS